MVRPDENELKIWACRAPVQRGHPGRYSRFSPPTPERYRSVLVQAIHAVIEKEAIRLP